MPAITLKTLYLPEAFDKADYYGFTLQNEYGYGITCRGQYCASSGWTVGTALAVYVKSETGWELRWYPTDKVLWEDRDLPCYDDVVPDEFELELSDEGLELDDDYEEDEFDDEFIDEFELDLLEKEEAI